LPVTADGRIDGDRLREKTRAALRRALSDPGLSVALGVPAVAIGPAGSSSPDDAALSMIAGAVYDGASALLVFLAARSGMPVDHARVLAFTPDEKRTLEAPTARVIQKYLPDLGGKYQDELVLALALTNVIAGKVVLMRSQPAQAAPIQAEQAS